jgi:hypothetical protein
MPDVPHSVDSEECREAAAPLCEPGLPVEEVGRDEVPERETTQSPAVWRSQQSRVSVSRGVW